MSWPPQRQGLRERYDRYGPSIVVSGILNVSQPFVAPFEGILRTDSLHAAGSVLDITAVVALVGWSVLARSRLECRPAEPPRLGPPFLALSGRTTLEIAV